MGEHPVRDWFYDWVVSLWIVWVLLAGGVYGITKRLVDGPVHGQQPALINAGDVDPAGTR